MSFAFIFDSEKLQPCNRQHATDNRGPSCVAPVLRLHVRFRVVARKPTLGPIRPVQRACDRHPCDRYHICCSPNGRPSPTRPVRTLCIQQDPAVRAVASPLGVCERTHREVEVRRACVRARARTSERVCVRARGRVCVQQSAYREVEVRCVHGNQLREEQCVGLPARTDTLTSSCAGRCQAHGGGGGGVTAQPTRIARAMWRDRTCRSESSALPNAKQPRLVAWAWRSTYLPNEGLRRPHQSGPTGR